jgi:penicillin-binding protein 1B
MVNAVLSAEDKRFFQHAGFDPLRVIKAAYVDVKSGQNLQGASTLSMQLAREIWGNKERGWQRKLPEILMTLHLERKLTKNEIFEHYTNQIDLGRVGSFNIHGFGEGAQVFFGKELRKLNLQEAALLAGIVQAPSRFNPLRNPDRARTRRNIILMMMRDNEYITQKEYEAASNAPLGVVSGGSDSEDAPYFAHYLNDQLQAQFQDRDFQEDSYRVYTTLDMNLQKAGAAAIKAGLKELNATAVKRGRTAAKGWPPIQAALVAIDAHTGEMLTMVGGEDYGASQLNRALAKRPPGSVFKPFVYAAALNTASAGGVNPITPASTVVDEPTTFWFDDKPYEPGNFGDKFLNAPVTMRYALSHSLNIPTIKFAEMAGYDTIVTLAKAAGMNNQIKATPAVALGAYEVTPIEVAGSYTIFSNYGTYVEPSSIKLIRDKDGKVVYTNKPKTRNVLDPRISYMMVDLLQEVLRSGTAAGVRGRGFTLPAAGKTGTSHDAWFAGFTSKIIAVVWVGYDDNRDVKMEGAKAALPIWTDFMKRAHEFSPYRYARGFPAPDGVVSVDIDSSTGKLAAGGCGGTVKAEVFLAGTQPLEYCNGSSATRVMAFAAEPDDEEKDEPRPARRSRRTTSIPISDGQTSSAKPAPPPAEKKGVINRILGWFGK